MIASAHTVYATPQRSPRPYYVLRRDARGRTVRVLVRPTPPHPALRRPPLRVATPRSMAPPLPGPLAQLAAPILQIENVGADLVQGIAHLLGAQDSLAASACAPGQAGWPACSIPGGSAGALVASGLSPAQAVVVAAAAASGTLGGGSARALTSVDRRPASER